MQVDVLSFCYIFRIYVYVSLHIDKYVYKSEFEMSFFLCSDSVTVALLKV